MGDLSLKPSRVRRMREIDNLLRDVKELRDEFEEYRRSRVRLARKARGLANKVRKQLPDMRVNEDSLGLHDQVEEMAQALYIPNNPQKEDPTNDIGHYFDRVFDFLRRLSDAPWLNPLG